MKLKKQKNEVDVASDVLSAEATVFKPNLVETDVRIIGDS